MSGQGEGQTGAAGADPLHAAPDPHPAHRSHRVHGPGGFGRRRHRSGPPRPSVRVPRARVAGRHRRARGPGQGAVRRPGPRRLRRRPPGGCRARGPAGADPAGRVARAGADAHPAQRRHGGRRACAGALGDVLRLAVPPRHAAAEKALALEAPTPDPLPAAAGPGSRLEQVCRGAGIPVPAGRGGVAGGVVAGVAEHGPVAGLAGGAGRCCRRHPGRRAGQRPGGPGPPRRRARGCRPHRSPGAGPSRAAHRRPGAPGALHGVAQGAAGPRVRGRGHPGGCVRARARARPRGVVGRRRRPAWTSPGRPTPMCGTCCSRGPRSRGRRSCRAGSPGPWPCSGWSSPASCGPSPAAACGGPCRASRWRARGSRSSATRRPPRRTCPRSRGEPPRRPSSPARSSCRCPAAATSRPCPARPVARGAVHPLRGPGRAGLSPGRAGLPVVRTRRRSVRVPALRRP